MPIDETPPAPGQAPQHPESQYPESTPPYPLTLDAELDRPSRGLWLIKWLLLIPHYIVLAILGIGAIVVWVIALFAILFTGRYPRPLFDYTVGVMRWGWRVSAYGYGLNGTDRYPPFTLADVPDYPAHLDVAYPEHLSRGLVLVKWWLLAIPHYIVTGLLYGGALGVTGNNDRIRYEGTGLISVLVLIAVVTLLFRSTYPRSIFDLVVGLQRWGLRVMSYALLLTDRYPPFRLDMGGTDPGHDRPAPGYPTQGYPTPDYPSPDYPGQGRTS